MLYGSFFSSPFGPHQGMGLASSAASTGANRAVPTGQPNASFGAPSPVFPSGFGGASRAGNFNGSGLNGLPQQQPGANPLAQTGMQSMTPDTQMLLMSITTMMAGLMTMIASLLTGILNGSISGQSPQGATPGAGTGPGASGATGPGGSQAPGASNPSGAAAPAPGSVGKGGNVDQWVDQAIQVLKAQGVPESKLNREDIKTIIQHESGGNPNAVNNWDSNAKKGTPSKGLMQTIQPTFDAHKLEGYGDILNPVHNIIAGVRYAIDRYGSVSNVPGIVGLKNGSGYRGY